MAGNDPTPDEIRRWLKVRQGEPVVAGGVTQLLFSIRRRADFCLRVTLLLVVAIGVVGSLLTGGERGDQAVYLLCYTTLLAAWLLGMWRIAAIPRICRSMSAPTRLA